MAELTVQFVRLETPAYEAIRQSGVASVMVHNPPLEPRFEGKDVVGRWVDDAFEGECLARGAAGADLWWQRYGPEVDARPWIRRWAFLNERECKAPEQARAIAAIIDRWMELAVAHGVRGPVGNFGQGQPEMGLAPIFWPIIQKAVRLGFTWGQHEYWWPRIGVATQETWNYWRIGRFFDELRTHVASLGEIYWQVTVEITECGADGGVADAGRIGWRRAGITEEEYIADLARYREGLPAYVARAYVFAVGDFGRPWDTFHLTARVFDGMTASNPAGGQPVPEPAPEEDGDVGETIIRVWRWALRRVDRMPLEEYLRGVIPAEMPASWPMEALKAQAVAARTYALRAMATPRHPAQGADLCDWTCCQVYQATTYARTDEAVRATAGETWDDPCQYVSKCGRVDCAYCQGQAGHDGKPWPGRLCQYGARFMAEQGAGWGEILTLYYGGEPVEAPAETPYLPEFTEAEVWAPLGVVDKTTWWLEEEERQREAGQLGRAEDIRLSLIRWLESRRERLRAH